VKLPKPAPTLARSIEAIGKTGRFPQRVAPTLPDGRYPHWDDFRRRPPAPGVTIEEEWGALKLARATRIVIPGFVDTQNVPFGYVATVDAIARATHALDRQEVHHTVLANLGDEALKKGIRIWQLVEEAIHSSVFEGAKLTTRDHARKMLNEKRPPSNHGERMVLNNYRAMERILSIRDRAITKDDLLEIHHVLGEDAMDSTAENANGRFRLANEDVRVEDVMTGEVWHTPPPASEVEKRIDAMLAFANEEGNEGTFVHPLIAAIVLHFWMAWIHPFTDGNGRMARSLFYWKMLRSGYEIAEYLSISGPIERAPTKYYMAFAHSESDEGDLTYFILHQLDVLREATAQLIATISDRATQIARLRSASPLFEGLNERQRSFLAEREPSGTTFALYAHRFGISTLTSRSDVQKLEERGLLRRVREGRQIRFYGTELIPH
jgi:Fic family protein